MKVFSTIVLFVLIMGNLFAQDDMYGDPYKPSNVRIFKSKLPKDSLPQEAPKMTKGVEWNDSVSSDYAILYFYRNKKYLANAVSVNVQVANNNAGNLLPGRQINYRWHSEGQVSVIATIDGVYVQLFVDVKDGRKYFFEIDLLNKQRLRQVTEEFAIENFSPLSVIRFSEQSLETKPQDRGKGSGTGFMISQKGHVVTNYHVIEGRKNIVLRGINGDYEKKYKAKILLSDKNNDLAVLAIEDSISIQDIPYSIQSAVLETGENIFVLGYPIISKMGEEIKVTNGIISSRSGYEGDISSYQISAAVQPGNSGGPVFNTEGNVIGIVNSKVMGAENVTYAVKSRVLNNLMEEAGSKITMSTQNKLEGKKLSEQIKLIRNYVLIIEVE